MSEYSRLQAIAQQPTVAALQQLQDGYELAAVARAYADASGGCAEMVYTALRGMMRPLPSKSITLEHDGTYTVLYGDVTVGRLFGWPGAAYAALDEFFEARYPRAIPAADTAPAPAPSAPPRTPIASPVSAGEDAPARYTVRTMTEAYHLLQLRWSIPVMARRDLAAAERLGCTCVAIVERHAVTVYDVRDDGRLGQAVIEIAIAG